MVRLQRYLSSAIVAAIAFFQSHYGAIATTQIQKKPAFVAQLSIPLWCDCNEVPDEQLEHVISLSIPLWCDCNHGARLVDKIDTVLSIPLWCDCNHLHHQSVL